MEDRDFGNLFEHSRYFSDPRLKKKYTSKMYLKCTIFAQPILYLIY